MPNVNNILCFRMEDISTICNNMCQCHLLYSKLGERLSHKASLYRIVYLVVIHFDYLQEKEKTSSTCLLVSINLIDQFTLT